MNEELLQDEEDLYWLRQLLWRGGCGHMYFASAVLHSRCGELIAVDLYATVDPLLHECFYRVALEDFPL